MSRGGATAGNRSWRLPPGDLVLASASPRRCELLSWQGLRFEVLVTSVDEQITGASPRAEARRLALAKADAGALLRPGCWVIGADTLVYIGRRILGKPAGAAQAREMLRLLSGREHRVVTAVAVVGPGFRRCGSRESRVRFRRLEGAEISSYVACGEPLDRAGAYAIQGRGAILVASLDGDWTNVVGLPLGIVRSLLAEAASEHRGRRRRRMVAPPRRHPRRA